MNPTTTKSLSEGPEKVHLERPEAAANNQTAKTAAPKVESTTPDTIWSSPGKINQEVVAQTAAQSTMSAIKATTSSQVASTPSAKLDDVQSSQI